MSRDYDALITRLVALSADGSVAPDARRLAVGIYQQMQTSASPAAYPSAGDLMNLHPHDYAARAKQAKAEALRRRGAAMAEAEASARQFLSAWGL